MCICLSGNRLKGFLKWMWPKLSNKDGAPSYCMCTLSDTDSSVSLIAWEGWGSGWCENTATTALWQLSPKTCSSLDSPSRPLNPFSTCFHPPVHAVGPELLHSTEITQTGYRLYRMYRSVFPRITIVSFLSFFCLKKMQQNSCCCRLKMSVCGDKIRTIQLKFNEFFAEVEIAKYWNSAWACASYTHLQNIC